MSGNLPVESQNGTSFEDYQVQTHYSDEDDVYDSTGYTSEFLMRMGSLSADQVSSMVNNFIARADSEIRRRLGIPIVVRKEGHEFFNNVSLQLGGDREDQYEMDTAYDPINKVVGVHRIWLNNYLLKVPYPRNFDQFTEPDFIDYWDAVGGTVDIDTDDFKCGTGSIVADITDSSGGSIVFPKNHNMNRRIYPWYYIGFWFKTDDPTATFTFRIVRDTGTYYYGTFNVNGQIIPTTNQVLLYQGFGNLPDTWVPMSLNIRIFRLQNIGGEGAQPDFNWMLVPTQYVEITANKPCKFWIDNFNFNDGIYATYPEGTIVWSMPMFYPSGKIEVSYAYDSWINNVPEVLNEASSKWAGVKLLDWLIGKRQMAIAFDLLVDTLQENEDKETLEATRRRLRQEGLDALNSIGFGSTEGLS